MSMVRGDEIYEHIPIKDGIGNLNRNKANIEQKSNNICTGE